MVKDFRIGESICSVAWGRQMLDSPLPRLDRAISKCPSTGMQCERKPFSRIHLYKTSFADIPSGVHMEFVVDKFALRSFFCEYFCYLRPIAILRMLDTRLFLYSSDFLPSRMANSIYNFPIL